MKREEKESHRSKTSCVQDKNKHIRSNLSSGNTKEIVITSET